MRIPVLALAVLTLVSACGKSDVKAPPPSPIQLVANPAASSGVTGDGAENWVQLATDDGSIGTVVTDIRGFTLYRFDKDKPNPPASNCSGDCAVTWPPVLIKVGGRVFVDGVDPKKVSAFRRTDGGVQVTVGGWPVYRFAKDTVPGDINGQGVGGTWFAVKPDGGKNTTLIAAAVVKAAQPDQTKTLAAKQTDKGAVLTDDAGATLYRNDKPCTGACTAQWRPVVAAGGQVQVSGVQTSRIASVRREDGTKQLTLDGSPLWRNAADKSTGTVITSAAAQGWTPAK